MKKLHSILVFLLLLVANCLFADTNMGNTNNSTSDNICKGVVRAGDNYLKSGLVYVYNCNDFSIFNDSAYIVSEGYFEVPGLNPDFYYAIQVIPVFDVADEYYPEYFPTYYCEEEMINNYRHEFLTYILGDNDDSIYVDLLSRDYIFYGVGSISGSVSYRSIIGNYDHPCVFLLANDFSPVKYSFLDANNSFSFNHIPFGDYYLYVDYFGGTDVEHSVSISAYSPNIRVAVITEEPQVTSVSNIKATAFNIYPNPFSDYIEIEFGENYSESISIQIYNSQGQKINSSGTQNSDNNIEFDTHNWSNGIYFIKIEDVVCKVIKSE